MHVTGGYDHFALNIALPAQTPKAGTSGAIADAPNRVLRDLKLDEASTSKSHRLLSVG